MMSIRFSRRIRVRRGVVAVAALALASAALAACGGGDDKSDEPLDKEADVTLTWWTGQADAAQTVLEDLAKEFESDSSQRQDRRLVGSADDR